MDMNWNGSITTIDKGMNVEDRVFLLDEIVNKVEQFSFDEPECYIVGSLIKNGRTNVIEVAVLGRELTDIQKSAYKYVILKQFSDALEIPYKYTSKFVNITFVKEKPKNENIQLHKSVDKTIEIIKKSIPMNIRGNLDIIKKGEDRIIVGYASVAIIDSENDYIPSEVLEKGLSTLMNDETYANLMLIHSSIQIGKILKEYEEHTTHVDEKGLYIVAQLRNDIKTANKVWEKILNEEYKGFSIFGEILEFHKECDDKSCVRVIDKLNLCEVSVCEYQINAESQLTVVSKSQVNCACGEHEDLIIKDVSDMLDNNNEVNNMTTEDIEVEKSDEVKIKEAASELSEVMGIEASEIEKAIVALKNGDEEEDEEDEDEEDENAEKSNDAPEPEPEPEPAVKAEDMLNAINEKLDTFKDEIMKSVTDKINELTQPEAEDEPEDEVKDLQMAVKARDDTIQTHNDEIKKLKAEIETYKEKIKKLESVEENPKTENVDTDSEPFSDYDLNYVRGKTYFTRK